MSLQLPLHEGKLFPIGSMSVANRHSDRRNNIHWDSLAQWWFSLYKLCSAWAKLLGYTKLLNLTECSHDKNSCADWLHGGNQQPTMRDLLKSWQDSHLQSPLITHGNARVHGVAWYWHWGGCPGRLAASLVSPKPFTVSHTTTRRSMYAVGDSEVLSRWRPRRWSPSHPLYILRTASCQLDGHNSYGVVRAFLLISVYWEAHNYTAIQCRRALPTLGPQGGIRNIPSRLQEVRTTPALWVARFGSNNTPLWTSKSPNIVG